MPAWAGKWKGGRYYLDAKDRHVYFIERRNRVIKLSTHDPDLALGELSRFLADPEAYVRVATPPPTLEAAPVLITKERLQGYMDSIRHAVKDHRKARRSYLHAWSQLGIDLRRTDPKQLAATLKSSNWGGHEGRTEALNAFARWLVQEGELSSWRPVKNPVPARATRAERQAYTIKELQRCWERLKPGRIKDVFLLRVATGMHQTEIDQLQGARLFLGPLPDKGIGIRLLRNKRHVIRGVLQVAHKSRHRHRQSVDAECLKAALRLRKSVPRRSSIYKALAPVVPSNLRHTFVTLAGERGELVTYVGGGVDRAKVAQAVGHREGSTMTADRYEKMQVPPMIRLPLGIY